LIRARKIKELRNTSFSRRTASTFSARGDSGKHICSGGDFKFLKLAHELVDGKLDSGGQFLEQGMGSKGRMIVKCNLTVARARKQALEKLNQTYSSCN
jgi:hypothetical protein